MGLLEVPIITNNKTSKNKESIDKISINPSSDGVTKNFRSPKSLNDKNDRLKNKLSEQREDIELLIKSNIEYDWYQDFFDETPDNSMNKGNVSSIRLQLMSLTNPMNIHGNIVNL